MIPYFFPYTDIEYSSEFKDSSHFAVLKHTQHIQSVFLKKRNIQQRALYLILLQTKENINKRNGKILSILCKRMTAVFPMKNEQF
jgi:hypothetical protein